MASGQPCLVNNSLPFTANIPSSDPDIPTFAYPALSSQTISSQPIFSPPTTPKPLQHQHPHGPILIRDPPRERLGGSTAEQLNPSVLARFPGKSDCVAFDSPDVYKLYLGQSPPLLNDFHHTPHHSQQVRKMTKKRRSIQSILVPSFLQGTTTPPSPTSPTSSTTPANPKTFSARMRSYSSVDSSSFSYGSMRSRSTPTSSVTSPRDSPPPDFLLDDDPFSNLSAGPVAPPPSTSPVDTSRSATPTPSKVLDATSPQKPRSPLTPPATETAEPTVNITSPRSSGVSLQRAPLPPPLPFTSRIQPRPAHQKPAFRSRPSLPSLHTLARMEYVVPKKIRKGRVGAGLPIDPWNQPDSIHVLSESPQQEKPSISQINVSATSQVTFPVTPVSPPALAQSHPLPSASLNVSPNSSTSPTTTASSEGPSCTPTTHTTPPANQTSLPPASTSPNSHDYLQPLMPSLPITSISDTSPDPAQLSLLLSEQLNNYQPHRHHQRLHSDSSQGQNSLAEDDLRSELPYTTDTDVSLDDLSSSPSLSRSESLELLSAGSLSRSDSLASTSSDSGSENYRRPSYTAEQRFTQSSSAESEGDILNSPPEDYFSVPLHISTTTMVADWRSRFGDPYELDSLPVSSAVSPLEVTFADKAHSGTSTSTIQASLLSSPGSSQEGGRESQRISDVVDGSGWGDGGAYTQRSYSLSRSEYNSNVERGNGGGSRGNGSSFIGGSGGGNGRSDEDRGDKRGWNRSRFVTPSSSEPTTSDDDYESAEEYGQPTADGAAVTQFPSGSGANSDDDDVPLAQRIPTALTAQRTIRRQVKEEREQRRKDRAARAEARSRQTTLRPAGAGGPNTQMLMSSSQEAAMHAAQPSSRQRTLTLPGSRTNAFSAEDLAKKLQNVQPPDVSSKHRRTGSASSGKEVMQSSMNGRSLKETYGYPPVSPLPTSPPPQQQHQQELPTRGLRPSRSFHRPERRTFDDHRPALPPMPVTGGGGLGRSMTSRARSKVDEDREGRTWQPRSYPNNPPVEEPVPKVPRMNEDYRKKAYPEAKSARTSGEAERQAERQPRASSSRPPVPPMSAPVALTQQRIFIGNMQQFNMVEVGPSTTAGDVLELVEAQGSLKGWAGTGGWMVWEVAQDFGMERPIRTFELLSDVQASWNKDKMVNTFIVKLTPLAIPLRRSNIPSSSPMFSGYVEWESKRGKWNKRWLQLREHSLWLSKRDNGKDEVHLCSLSNFDAYHITRLYKAPKPFVFAVKSTDNMSFFENTADYLHVFSCKEEDGKAWMEKILVARSYVLYQERNVLFNPRAAGGNGSGAALSSLTRAGTTRKSRPTQPLVDVPAHQVFEPGSLLHRQS